MRRRDVYGALVALHGRGLVALLPKLACAGFALLAAALAAALLVGLVWQWATIKHHQRRHASVRHEVDASNAVRHMPVSGLALDQLTRAGVGAAVQQAVGIDRDCALGKGQRISSAAAGAVSCGPRARAPVLPR